MFDSSMDDIKKDFINELKDYIPNLRDKVSGLADPSNNRHDKDLKELYRLVHTIKGASSLVKLLDLSEVASELEEIIEAAMNQNLALNSNVFDAIKRFKGKSLFATWLFRITINVANQEIRQRGRRRRLDSALSEAHQVKAHVSVDTPEKTVQVQREVYEILDQLPLKKRETYILYMYEGYSLEEIADLLDSSVSTIGSRLQSARKEIVRILSHRRRRR